MALAFGAEISALRIQTLLPPHIAEASDPRMDEARMTREDEQVRSDLEGLSAVPKVSGDPDLAVAASRYAQFREIKGQILALSRENTNVSIAIHLAQSEAQGDARLPRCPEQPEAIGREPIEGGRFRAR